MQFQNTVKLHSTAICINTTYLRRTTPATLVQRFPFGDMALQTNCVILVLVQKHHLCQKKLVNVTTSFASVDAI